MFYFEISLILSGIDILYVDWFGNITNIFKKYFAILSIFLVFVHIILISSKQIKKELANMLLILVGLGLASMATILMANEEF